MGQKNKRYVKVVFYIPEKISIKKRRKRTKKTKKTKKTK